MTLNRPTFLVKEYLKRHGILKEKVKKARPTTQLTSMPGTTSYLFEKDTFQKIYEKRKPIMNDLIDTETQYVKRIEEIKEVN